MITIGIDASLTGTGVCVLKTEKGSIQQILEVGTIKTKLFGVPRLQYIRDTVKALIIKYPIPVFIEGYSFGSKGSSVYDLGELGGVLRVMLYENKITYKEIPPSTLKKYISGKGNAKKEIMLEQTYRKFGFGSEILKDNDQVDAFCLAVMGANCLYYQQDPAKYSKEHRAVFSNLLGKYDNED